MKTALRVIGIIVLIIVLLIAAGFSFLYYVLYHAPMVPKEYWNEIETGGSIEANYLACGTYEVAHITESAEEPINKYVIYYPKELDNDKYPVVMVVNGTGVFANKEKSLFEHLASWGFVVIGNYDGSTWSGNSANMTLDYLLDLNTDKNSIFYQKIDNDNIGITGHSQGGVGVFNAIQDSKHNELYKCAVSISPTEEDMAAVLKMPYDASKTTIPIFLLAGTENDVISIEKLEQMYSAIRAEKVMAVKSGQTHGEMLYAADGYVTAWFMWLLQNDMEAANAFTGDNAEIKDNPVYQNQNYQFAEDRYHS